MGRLEDMESGLKSRGASQADTTSPYTILDLEIDRTCQPASCNSSFVLDAGQHIPLFGYSEVPDYMRGNPYVKSGYRVLLPTGLCLQSLFVWSNETVNIWSHLIGFMYFSIVLFYDNFVLLPLRRGSLADHLIISAAIICYMFCMLFSAGYHLFHCHSEKASKRWLAADLAGVSVGLIGCYLPAVHYAFYCLSIWRDIYLIVISVLSSAVLFFQFHPHYFSPSWSRHRTLLYCALTAYGIIPSAHWVYLSGGWEDKLVQIFIPKVAVMYLLGCIAFTFYLSKFPERCFPGRVDYIGSSHQWWHVIVVFAFYYWHNTGQEFLEYRQHEQCLV